MSTVARLLARLCSCKSEQVVTYEKPVDARRSSLVSTAARTSISSPPDDATTHGDGTSPAQLLAQKLLIQQRLTKAQTRRGSDERYSERGETTILLDFDDFLLATYEIRRRGLNWSELMSEAHELKPQFMRLERILTKFLLTCHSLGNIAIVTLAKPPWVQLTMSNFLPNTKKAVASLEIPVYYALEELRAADSAEGVKQMGTTLKQRAMESYLSKIYKNGKSWKNVISIGDSVYEQRALQNVMHEYKVMTGNRKCRCKTVKLREQPDFDTLIHQLTILNDYMEKLVKFQYSCDIDVTDAAAAQEVWLHWTRKLDGTNLN